MRLGLLSGIKTKSPRGNPWKQGSLLVVHPPPSKHRSHACHFLILLDFRGSGNPGALQRKTRLWCEAKAKGKTSEQPENEIGGRPARRGDWGRRETEKEKGRWVSH